MRRDKRGNFTRGGDSIRDLLQVGTYPVLPEAHLQRLLSRNERGNVLDSPVGNIAVTLKGMYSAALKHPSSPSGRDVAPESEVLRGRVRKRSAFAPATAAFFKGLKRKERTHIAMLPRHVSKTPTDKPRNNVNFSRDASARKGVMTEKKCYS